MKIPSLLAQYFYCHQRLDLPGIGTFSLDNAAISALEKSKQRSALLEGVGFKSNPSLKETPELIAFIAQKTGKMKALAASDLDSHLRIAEQFLNIGKPFALEGIGIISKGKHGELEFTPITVLTEKVKEYNTKEAETSSSKEQSSGDYESFLSPSKTNLEWKKPVAGLLLVCGIGLTIWGGYEISKNANKNKTTNLTESSITGGTTVPVADSSQVQKNDSIKAIPNILPANNNYKYVLEIAKSQRAFKRYNQLKSIQWKVQLETKDSVQYKLFMLLPAISDTSRTIDSLTVMSGRKVYIEYPN
ncbi:MAG: hypothetical protein ABI675_22220 [Chitinophagaceae bacterium]